MYSNSSVSIVVFRNIQISVRLKNHLILVQKTFKRDWRPFEIAVFPLSTCEIMNQEVAEMSSDRWIPSKEARMPKRILKRLQTLFISAQRTFSTFHTFP